MQPKSRLIAVVTLAIAISLFLMRNWLQFSTSLIGRDSSLLLWSLWYPVQAIRLNQDIITTNYSVFPIVNNLLLVFSPLLSALWQLLRSLQFSGPFALNSLYVIGLFFTGWTLFAYLRHRHVKYELAIFFAVFWLCSPVLHYRLLQGRPDLMLLGWIPLGCLVWDQVETGKQRNWCLSGVAIAALLTSPQVFLWANLIWLPYFAKQFLQAKTPARQAFVQALLWLWLTGLAVAMMYPLPVLLKTLAGVTPTVQAIALQPQEWSLSPGFISMGICAALLLGASLTPQALKQNGFWLGLAGLYFILGDLAHMGWFSLWSNALAPVDWLVPAGLAFVLFLALSLTSRWANLSFNSATWQAKGISCVVLLTLLLGVGWQAQPLTVPWQASPVYTKLGEEPSPYTVMDVPLGVHLLTTGEHYGPGASLQQYAIAHHQRTINGSYANADNSPIQLFEQTALFPFLAGKGKSATPPMRQELQNAIRELQIGYVIIHLTMLEKTQSAEILNFFADPETSLCRVFIDSEIIAYRTDWHPWGCRPLVE